jgi:hypothetical protein
MIRFAPEPMDALALETCVLNNKEQPEFRESADWRQEFSLD